jgi:pimeloyl-ACP methyl ester carboxylesterase
MRHCIFFYFLFILNICGFCQHKVTFSASDSLRITADLYFNNYNYPFILLFHQNGYSRGEYAGIAEKLMNLDYNCLAVDLRSGGKVNYIKNETAARAQAGNMSCRLIDSRKDILAAIEYTKKYNDIPVILFGSSYSASLCILVGKNNKRVNAVIAFSPGEYFEPEISVKNALKDFNKPLFVSSSENEYSYILNMLDFAPDSILTIYRHKEGNDYHGANVLWESNITSKECWLELLMFFRKIK